MNPIDLAERRWLPDSLIRFGIRRLLINRLHSEGRDDEQRRRSRRDQVMEMLRQSPVAVATDAANEQHYEVPSAFFEQVLGPRLKYSCCYWDGDVHNLAQAEEAMLTLYCQRAELQDGQQVLELGCGWGSLSLWIASRYPNSRITAVSNSSSQKQFIDHRAHEMGVNNLTVITADVNEFSTDQQYDRVVTVEMLEHVRNYPQLFERIAGWLRPDGKLFAHIFCHDQLLYPFEVEGRSDWMAKYFFTGGVMPSFDTFNEFQQHLQLTQTWRVPGWHYQKTADAWLHNQDSSQDEVMAILRQAYGDAEAKRWWQRWRMFFMACSELFGYRQGQEWLVGHYLWQRR
ncbi:MAG: cyclopropane-fatty-acyl-phospholipid synthase family protein [Wenzhouxiangellaceae bacterium]